MRGGIIKTSNGALLDLLGQINHISAQVTHALNCKKIPLSNFIAKDESKIDEK
jgi:hypothetical protein